MFIVAIIGVRDGLLFYIRAGLCPLNFLNLYENDLLFTRLETYGDILYAMEIGIDAKQ